MPIVSIQASQSVAPAPTVKLHSGFATRVQER